jgi:hypothetical protein
LGSLGPAWEFLVLYTNEHEFLPQRHRDTEMSNEAK